MNGERFGGSTLTITWAAALNGSLSLSAEKLIIYLLLAYFDLFYAFPETHSWPSFPTLIFILSGFWGFLEARPRYI